MDNFFTQTTCDRCHGSLDDGRIMSMFNKEVICMNCKQAEKNDPEYLAAVEADHAEIKKGNYNYEGLKAKRGDTANDFQKTLYVHTLAIILEKLQIPFEFVDGKNLEFDLHIFRDQHINTTDMSINDIDNVIKLILTR